MVTYKLYLDGVLINERPKGLDDLILAIEREDGFSNSEQILRESMDAQLEFSGDGYRYICTKRQQNYCEEILCSLDAECEGETETLFEGMIKQKNVEVALKKCIAKTSSIKDNSFSGLLRDWINIEVPLYNTKTKNCQPLSIPTILINTPTHSISGVYYPITDVRVFDVLEVFKYIVAFFTDNRITVKSTYLTNNKYAITSGFNLHNEHGNLDKIYPSISFETLFNELRKKLVLYMGIEYEVDGTPYLRIEEEGYFYTDDELFTIDELPEDAAEKMDENSLYNQIVVGSKMVKLQEDSTVIKSQDRLDAWNEETYLGCGGCSGQKDSDLDLISSFIIDANIIHEAMLQPIPATPDDSDYTNDDAIFLLNYFISGGGPRFYFPSGYNAGGFTNDGYNKLLNNRYTLERWVGVSNSCISTLRHAKYGFITRNNNYSGLIQGAAGVYCDFDKVSFLNIDFDNENSLSIGSIPSFTSPCDPLTVISENFTQFTCQEVGVYNFKSKVVNIHQDGGPFELAEVKYTLTINVFSDNTYTSLLTNYVIEKNVLSANNVTSIEIESGNIGLSIGNIVQVDFLLESIGATPPYNFPFSSDYFQFELLSDNFTCENLIDQTDSFKPFLTTFQYPICLDKYKIIKKDKRGYILVEGQKLWIKRIEFRPNKLSTLQLKHKRSLCYCI